MNNLNIVYKKVDELILYVNNSRTHNNEQVTQIASSIKEFGFNNPILLDGENGVIAGHGRLLASKKLGLKDVPCVELSHLTKAQKKAYIIADNKIALNSDWDNDVLKIELEDLKLEDFDLPLLGFTDSELSNILDTLDLTEEDEEKLNEVPEVTEEVKSQLGDVFYLGEHRLMCGDSSSEHDVNVLLDNNKIDLIFTDPPYGMKKEKDGVLNDNLNFQELLEFNKKWIDLCVKHSKENGSFYCWGIDEVLMDIYAFILKPLIKEQKATFRNLITWDKGSGQGQLSEECRMYPIADEKCLFFMFGVQDFNDNSDNYFQGWEPIRKYLYDSRVAMGWDVPTMKKIVGHSDLLRDHWTSTSQFSLIPEYAYKLLQEQAEKERKEKQLNNEAFKREYDDIKREYDDIKREYDDIKREYYSTRAYFNNTHDNMNNVWHFSRTSAEERATTGGHATPKPIKFCARAILSSSRQDEKVLDLFGGSGSTLIACEQLNRKCFMMELDPKYCDVIIKRWQTVTNKEAIRADGVKFNEL